MLTSQHPSPTHHTVRTAPRIAPYPHELPLLRWNRRPVEGLGEVLFGSAGRKSAEPEGAGSDDRAQGSAEPPEAVGAARRGEPVIAVRPPERDGYGRPAATRDMVRHPAAGRMIEKRAADAGRAGDAQRTWWSEAPSGWITHTPGFRHVGLRRRATVRDEWDWVCLALNVGHLQPLLATWRPGVHGLSWPSFQRDRGPRSGPSPPWPLASAIRLESPAPSDGPTASPPVSMTRSGDSPAAQGPSRRWLRTPGPSGDHDRQDPERE